MPTNASAIETDVGMNASERKKRLQHFREILFTQISQRETREGDAELGGGQIGVQMCPNVFGETGALISLLD